MVSNKFITNFALQKTNKERRCENEMNRRKWLIYRILDLLALIENDRNQPIVNQIRGLLFELLEN